MRKVICLLALSLSAAAASGEVVYHVPIQGTIDLGLPPFVERVVEQASTELPAAIILDIDTFGGRIDGATQIKDAIMSAKIPTVAFINRRAISAGALIALSCEQVYMAKGATIGAATAVNLEGEKWYRVRVGSFQSREGALEIVNRLREEEGLEGSMAWKRE